LINAPTVVLSDCYLTIDVGDRRDCGGLALATMDLSAPVFILLGRFPADSLHGFSACYMLAALLFS
jgi:hypothetical protein